VAACLAGVLNLLLLASPLLWASGDTQTLLCAGSFLLAVALLFGVEQYASSLRDSDVAPITSADREAVLAGLCGSLLIFVTFMAGVVERVTQAGNRFDWLETLGLGLMLGGCLLRYLAIRTLAGRFRTETALPADYELQTSGIYSIVRHPSELGLLVLLAGAALLLSSRWAWLLTALQAPMVAWRVSIENGCFERALGERFQSYRRQVAGFIPYLF